MFNKTLCGNPAVEHQAKGVTTEPGAGQKIVVNEIFGPTIQGEGKSVMKQVMFLRTAGCNLACIWCDTPYTWNWEGTKFQHPQKFNPKNEMHPMEIQEVLAKLQELGPRVKSLVISGGEPMLQQERLISLMKLLKSEGYWVEVETNGTIQPTEEFYSLIDQINCSPKLSNSGTDNPLQKRERYDALVSLSKNAKTNFKFVVSRPEDIVEILGFVRRYQMKDVYLMPEGRTSEELKLHETLVRKLCKEHGFHYSGREQIVLFGNKRAV